MVESKSGSFDFYEDYIHKVMNLQPEYYNEIKSIINKELNNFILTNNRKPLVLDIGSAGLLPYETNLAEKIIILDIFPKPKNVELIGNCNWIVGDILSSNIDIILNKEDRYDFIIMSSLLHHLCNKKNNIIKNLNICFENSSKLLSLGGKIFIFESTCPELVTKLEDLFYPFYSWILIKVVKFTCIRMLSIKEIIKCLEGRGFDTRILLFKQPTYIAQMYWKVPSRIYPLRINAFVAIKNK